MQFVVSVIFIMVILKVCVKGLQKDAKNEKHQSRHRKITVRWNGGLCWGLQHSSLPVCLCALMIISSWEWELSCYLFSYFFLSGFLVFVIYSPCWFSWLCLTVSHNDWIFMNGMRVRIHWVTVIQSLESSAVFHPHRWVLLLLAHSLT